MYEDEDFVTDALPDLLARQRPVVRQCPQLLWTDAAGAHRFALDDRAVLGSGSGVDLAISDPAVSRLHAEFERRDDGVWVRDLGSRNGTFVEALRVSGARVPDHGRVRIGSTELTVSQAAAPTVVELWPSERFGQLRGRSTPMRELFARLAKAAATDASVLIQGETGTGKELVAQALHDTSPRASRPFVVVDCGALPEALLEAELFGHAKGAFTGALAARGGAIEAAEGGTVFLDEVGELPLAMQPKLLRVLETRTVRRIGEAHPRAVDVRFVSATHRDLRRMVNAQTFREDLYFRLAVLPVRIAPLRARPDDVPLLVEHFLRPGTALDPALVHSLASRPWPGNVRELRNFVERAVTFGSGEAIASLAAEVPEADATAPREALPPVSLDAPFKTVRERWLDHVEREYVRGMLARHRGNVSAAASAAGLTRAWVHRLVRKHDL